MIRATTLYNFILWFVLLFHLNIWKYKLLNADGFDRKTRGTLKMTRLQALHIKHLHNKTIKFKIQNCTFSKVDSFASKQKSDSLSFDHFIRLHNYGRFIINTIGQMENVDKLSMFILIPQMKSFYYTELKYGKCLKWNNWIILWVLMNGSFKFVEF